MDFLKGVGKRELVELSPSFFKYSNNLQAEKTIKK